MFRRHAKQLPDFEGLVWSDKSKINVNLETDFKEENAVFHAQKTDDKIRSVFADCGPDKYRQDVLMSAILFLRKQINENDQLQNQTLKDHLLAAAAELEKQSQKLAHTSFHTKKSFFIDAMIVTCRLIYKAKHPAETNNSRYGCNTKAGNAAVKRLGEYRRLQGALRMAFGASLGTAAVLSMFLSGGIAIPIVLAVVALAYTVYELKQPQNENRLWYGAKRVGATGAGSTAFAMTALTPATMTTTAMVQMTGVAAASIFALVASVFALRKGFYQFFTMTNRGVRDAAGKAFDAGLTEDKIQEIKYGRASSSSFSESKRAGSVSRSSVEADESASRQYDQLGRRGSHSKKW